MYCKTYLSAYSLYDRLWWSLQYCNTFKMPKGIIFKVVAGVYTLLFVAVVLFKISNPAMRLHTTGALCIPGITKEQFVYGFALQVRELII